MRRFAFAWLAAGLGVGAAALSIGRASDHLDGPRTTADPQADLADVFAFTSPENPAHVVLALTVTPFAAAKSAFSDRVDYVFRVRRVAPAAPLMPDATVLDVTCTFDNATPQTVTCKAPGGQQARATVGDTQAGDPQAPMRVFAGLRSDPAFFDREGTLATLRTGRAAFTGVNAFAGANVLAIVVELDTRAAFVALTDAGPEAGTDAGAAPRLPVLAVAAETVRRSR